MLNGVIGVVNLVLISLFFIIKKSFQKKKLDGLKPKKWFWD